MKTLLVLAICFIAVQALTIEQRKRLKDYRSQCFSLNSRVDRKLVNELRLGYFKTENEPLKKYVHCILMKAGLMTASGAFKKDVALAKTLNLADKPEVKKLLDKCLVHKGRTPQQSAWNYSKCFYQHATKFNETIFQ
ncbi:general odorant-binding protein 56d-like [Vanessa cardui]|uniref:general odorant-binding protein 56d-like n=1 Tax=Vanessa cardui TaxID=171605 RepID=UPI001F130E98|nr:general odorant-binding protein 56d-like [Vanessa cardui]